MDKKTEPVVLASGSEGGKVVTLTINRPKQLNAMNDWVYEELIKQLDIASKDEQVAIVVLAGSDFRGFCAGADLAAGFDPFVGPLKSMKGSYHDPVGRFMTAVIRFNKPLVAAVQGIAVGVGMTILPHCDLVFAVPHATFEAPFTKVGVCPEFCSSITFPRLMGPSLSSQVLYFGRKLSAQEAKACNLVGEIIHATNREAFLQAVYDRIRPSLAYPNSTRSMRLFKQLIKNPSVVAELEQVHRTEMALLDERSVGKDSEAAQGVAAILASQKKAKI
jgi:enoyl-CoA hydratase/carnithine racemase